MPPKIEDPDHFARVVEFATNNKCADKLFERLDCLAGYSGDPATTCHLYRDHAPHSFAFGMKRHGQHWFTDGLIYSGPGQALDGSGPAFAVGIGIDSSKHGWSVHT